MGKRRRLRRKPRLIGGAGLTTTRTRAGRALLVQIIDGDDFDAWLGCFQAAIAGTEAAQRRTPNPHLVVRHAASVAGMALHEVKQRRPPRRKAS